jgi:hypothetical protein
LQVPWASDKTQQFLSWEVLSVNVRICIIVMKKG